MGAVKQTSPAYATAMELVAVVVDLELENQKMKEELAENRSRRGLVDSR